MVLMQFDRWTERLWFEAQDEPEDPQPAGALAVSILGTLAPNRRQQDAAVRRLSKRTDGLCRGLPPKRGAADSLVLIAEQIRVWSERRRVTWTGAYGEDDPDDGPTDVLSNAQARRLLRGIEWRGPDVIRVTSPEAAVFLSALYGAKRGTLVGCLKCNRLSTVSRRQMKRRACPSCGARRRSASGRVIREYELAYDRVRKSRLLPEQKQPLWKRIAEIRESNRCGKVSAADAIEQIRDTVPRGPRGRRVSPRA
jgi:hypothetical protein